MPEFIYCLWVENLHVDQSGHSEPPELAGLFASLESLNDFIKAFPFELCGHDTSDIVLTDEGKHVYRKFKGKTYDSTTSVNVYFEIKPLIN